MHFVAETKLLASAVYSVLGIIDKSNIKPIFSNIKLSVDKAGYLYIQASNIDVTLCKKIPVQIIDGGSATVSGRMMHSILKKIIDSEVNIVFSPTTMQLEVKGKNCKFALSTLPVESFIEMDVDVDMPDFIIRSNVMLEMLESTYFSMSTDEIRYNMNGICMHSNENSILCSAATNCHRLSMVNTGMEVEKQFNFILPRKTSEELIKLAKIVDNISCYISDSLVKFETSDSYIVSKLVDGKFPEYQSFIPTNNRYYLTIKAGEILNSIDRVSTVAQDKTQAIKLEISQEKIVFYSYNDLHDTAQEVLLLPKGAYNGEQIVIGFNPNYLLDIFRYLEENEKIELSFFDNSSGVVVRSLSREQFLFITMPINVD